MHFDPVEKPGVSNLLTIFSALSGQGVDEIESAYAGKGYGDFKADLADLVVEFVTPVQEKVRHYLDDTEALDAVLAAGGERARGVAVATMELVRERVGFLPRKV